MSGNITLPTGSKARLVGIPLEQNREPSSVLPMHEGLASPATSRVCMEATP